MRVNRIGLLGWVLLAVVVGYGVIRANQADEKLQTLRQENAVLKAKVSDDSLVVEQARDRVVAADSAAAVVEIETSAEIDSTDARLEPIVTSFEAKIAGDPMLVAGFDSVKAGYESRIAAGDSALAKQKRAHTLQLAQRDAQILAFDTLTASYRKDIANLERQVRVLDPPFFVGLFRDLPKLAATAGGAYVGSLVADETGAAIGAVVGSLVF